ncbi:MAG: endonuclease/exonuclease/phosphatase family protein [Gemmatimonadota bacterium]|nr:MAG: endonuclease/exonuclease/phosphatase family protein [Gemmatimonadota bacterium]
MGYPRPAGLISVPATLILVGIILAARAASHPQTPNKTTRIRILSYNIRHGEGMDTVIDLDRTAKVIRALRPDIVALQEVDSAVERTGRVHQAEVLGRLTGMQHVFGGFFDYQGGRYGMALLSRFPIASFENHRLPDGLEPRTALAARIVPAGSTDTLIVVGIHLYATAEERQAQASRIVDIFRGNHLPVLLAGDFNSTPESDVMALFRTWENPDKGDDHLTFPSREPEREIDYVLYRPADRFQIVEIDVIDEPLASDHRPVLVELGLSGRG